MPNFTFNEYKTSFETAHPQPKKKNFVMEIAARTKKWNNFSWWTYIIPVHPDPWPFTWLFFSPTNDFTFLLA